MKGVMAPIGIIRGHDESDGAGIRVKFFPVSIHGGFEIGGRNENSSAVSLQVPFIVGSSDVNANKNYGFVVETFANFGKNVIDISANFCVELKFVLNFSPIERIMLEVIGIASYKKVSFG